MLNLEQTFVLFSQLKFKTCHFSMSQQIYKKFGNRVCFRFAQWIVIIENVKNKNLPELTYTINIIEV